MKLTEGIAGIVYERDKWITRTPEVERYSREYRAREAALNLMKSRLARQNTAGQNSLLPESVRLAAQRRANGNQKTEHFPAVTRPGRSSLWSDPKQAKDTLEMAMREQSRSEYDKAAARLGSLLAENTSRRAMEQERDQLSRDMGSLSIKELKRLDELNQKLLPGKDINNRVIDARIAQKDAFASMSSEEAREIQQKILDGKNDAPSRRTPFMDAARTDTADWWGRIADQKKAAEDEAVREQELTYEEVMSEIDRLDSEIDKASKKQFNTSFTVAGTDEEIEQKGKDVNSAETELNELRNRQQHYRELARQKKTQRELAKIDPDQLDQIYSLYDSKYDDLSGANGAGNGWKSAGELYTALKDTPADADFLLEYFMSDTWKKDQEKRREDAAQFAKEQPVLSSLASIPVSLVEGVTGTLSIAGQKIANNFREDGDYRPIDVPMSYSRTIRGTIGERLENDLNESKILGQDSGAFLYNTGMSMADSAFATAVSAGFGSGLGLSGEALKSFAGKAATGLISAGAVPAAFEDAKARGLNDNQAFSLAVLAGVIEAATEKFSVEALLSKPKSVVGYLLKNTLTEASEEAISEVANKAADVIVARDQSEWSSKIRELTQSGMTESQAAAQAFYEAAQDVLASGLGGALSGAGMSGAGLAGHTAASYFGKESSQNGTQGIEQGSLDAAHEEAGESAQISPAVRESVEQAFAQADNAAQLERLQEQIRDAAPEAEKAGVDRAFAEIARERGMEGGSEIAQNGQNVQKMGQNTEAGDLYGAAERETQQNAGRPVLTDPAAAQDGPGSGYAGKAAVLGAQVTAGETGKEMLVTGIESVGANDAVLRTSGGETVKLSEAAFADEAVQALYHRAAQHDMRGANAFLRHYNANMPVDVYGQSFDYFYRAGQMGVPLKPAADFVSNTTQMLGMDAVRAAYNTGAQAAKAEVSMRTPAVLVENPAGSFTDRTGYAPGGFSEIARLASKKLGVDIEYVPTLDGGNGQYLVNRAKILVAADSKNNFGALMHELGEHMKAQNPQGADVVTRTLVGWYAQKEGYSTAGEFIEGYRKTYEQYEGSKTYRDAMDEFSFDLMGDLFGSEEGLKSFLEYLNADTGLTVNEKRTVLQRIADVLKRIVAEIREMLGDPSLGREARNALQAEQKQAEKMRRLVLEALEQTTQNREQATKNTAAKSGGDKSSSIRFSLKESYPYDMQKVIGDYIDAVDTDLKTFLEAVDEKKTKDKEKYWLQPVSEASASDIKIAVGIDTSGFQTAIEARMIEHILKRHGENGEADHSMRNLNDLARIQYVLNHYDSVSDGGFSEAYTTIKPNGKPGRAKTVLYEKKINGTYYIVEAVPETKAHTVYIVSAYIKKKGAPQLIDTQNAPTQTPEAASVVTPSSSLSFSDSDVNRQYMQKGGDDSGNVRYSLIADERGGYRVLANRGIFDGVAEKEKPGVLKQFVFEALRGKEFRSLIDGEAIQVAQKNKVVQKLWRPGMHMHSGKYTARMEAASHLDEAIQGSSFDRHEENYKGEKLMDASGGFDKRTFTLEIPCFDKNGKFLSAEVWECELTVPVGQDGKKIAYDISRLTKKKNAYSVLYGLRERGREIDKASFEQSIQQAGILVNSQDIQKTEDDSAEKEKPSFQRTLHAAVSSNDHVAAKGKLSKGVTQLADAHDAPTYTPQNGSAATPNTTIAQADTGVNRQYMQKGGDDSGNVRYSINPEFARKYDEWDKQTGRFSFRIGTTSEPLKSIGVKDQNIWWDATKIKKIRDKHPGMTDEVIKQVPNILEDPILIMESQTVPGRLTLFGEVYDAKNHPVLVALELSPIGKGGHALDVIKIASAYGKDTNPQRLIDQSRILYVDPNKNRTNSWLSVNRLQLPLPSFSYGSINTIASSDTSVNRQYMQKGGDDSGNVRYSINPEFAAEYDAWDKKKDGFSFLIGTVSEPLNSIGVNSSKIYFDASKIKKIRDKHPGMTDSIIKQIPNILEYPILIMESQTVPGRLTLFGEVYDAKNHPVLAALELNPTDRKGRALNVIKIASAYGKDVSPQRLLDQSRILYVDPNKNRTNSWLGINRLQLPLPSTSYGSINTIASSDASVNRQYMQKGGDDSGNVRHSFAGIDARTANIQRLENAKERLQNGEDSETVRQETGWFQGADGKWRFEIDDSGVVFDPEGRLNGAGRGQYLNDYLQHDALYEAYPDLKTIEMEVKSASEMPPGALGAFLVNDNKIVLTLGETDLAETKSILLHEVQHAVQKLEGFSAGASLAYWVDILDEDRYPITRDIMDAQEALLRFRSRTDAKIIRKLDRYKKKLHRAMAYDRRHGTDTQAAVREEIKGAGLYEQFWEMDRLESEIEAQKEFALNMSPHELYFNTAGEIESRDVQLRADMLPEERRQKKPDTGGQKTVFSDRTEESCSIRVDSEGAYVHVDVDQKLFDGLSMKGMQATARKYIMEAFRGKVFPVGDDSTAFVNKRSSDEYSHPANRRMDDGLKEPKMRASTELDHLLEVSQFLRHDEDDGRHKDATGGWDVYRTRFMVGSEMFTGEVKIKLTDRGRLFYDVTKIERTARNGGQTETNSAAASGSSSIDTSLSFSGSDVNRQYMQKGGNDSGYVRYSVNPEFAAEIDSWNREGRDGKDTFTLGSTGDTLQGLGARENDIYMRGEKISKILRKHPEMTLEEIKRIPEILDDPILVLASKNRAGTQTNNTRLVMFGNVKAQNGRPVLCVLDLMPVENKILIDDLQKLTSAYTKTKNPEAFIQNSEVLYISEHKKRAAALLRSTGLQIWPAELQRVGSLGSISYKERSVNISGVPFSQVVPSIGAGTTANAAAQSGGAVRHSVNPEFAGEYDAWDRKVTGFSFVFETKSETLEKLGIKARHIQWDAGKIRRLIERHPGMTDEMIKQVPNVLEDPVLIMEPKEGAGRLLFVGGIYDAAGRQALTVVELRPMRRQEYALNLIRAGEAVGKEVSVQRLIDQSRVLYERSGAREMEGFEEGLAAEVKKTSERVENPVKSSILKDINLEPLPITMDSLKRVKAFECGCLDGEGQKALVNAHKRLLASVAGRPLGTEASAVYGLDMRRLGGAFGEDAAARVKIPDYNVPYIGIHTHPTGGTFTHTDIELFARRGNMVMLTALGNDGAVFALEKTSEFNAKRFLSYYDELLIRHPKVSEFLDVVSRGDEISSEAVKEYANAYADFINNLLGGIENHGIKYYTGTT